MDHRPVEYLQWAQGLYGRVRFDLASSDAPPAGGRLGCDDVAFYPRDAGRFGWLSLLSPRLTGRKLTDRLVARYETVVAPGGFFGVPAAVRLALGSPEEALREGLGRLGEALDSER